MIIEIDCYYNLIRQFKGSILFAGFRKKNNEQFLEASLPLKNKKGEKMRKENENKIIDNQSNRIHPLGILFHCQSTRCPQGPMTL